MVTVGTANYLADQSGQILISETVPVSTQMTVPPTDSWTATFC